ncbi:glycosyltransferase family 4 protein [Pseudomonas sp. SAICEU22]|uniref:Glycosyltransferase family 4 protein n=1 Tax=Pseudomonas agronomica TaxID=2979328 RepID=A0ABT3F5E7_9PSED|nr:glycosyltransferase family 4 protein [Pseudomonas agronomica]MCW1244315.1 glycosyltransferase family 4 protein [Pseudomonas agronomica]
MNIWYINPYAGGPGVGRYWRSFYLAKAWQAQGHDVEIIAPSYHHLMDDDSGKAGCQVFQGVSYRFVHVPKYKGNGLGRFFSMLCFGFSLFFFLVRLGLKKRPDLVLYSSAHPFGYPTAFLCAKLFRSKILFEVRDIWPLSLVEIAGFNKFHPVVIALSLIEKFAYFSADAVISLLPGAKQHMVSRGMRAGKFRYVPNGFSLDDVNVSGKTEGSNLLDDLTEFKSQGDFLFFYAGALGEPNAMHLFLDALQFFNIPDGLSVKFIIVGKGEQRAELDARCRKLGYDFVLFYPQVDKAEVQQALCIVDVGFFVMHDLPIYRFGVSLNKLYDYMAAGIPVIASYKAFNDPIAQAGCGMSVIPGQPEQLAHMFREILLLDDAVLRDMGMKGRVFLEANFEYASLARRILENN